MSLGVNGEQQRCTEKRAAESSVTMRGRVVFAAGGGNQQGGAGANRFPTSERIRAAGRITLSCAATLGALTEMDATEAEKANARRVQRLLYCLMVVMIGAPLIVFLLRHL